MKRICRFFCILLALTICILSNGCTAIGIDVESHLRPPNNNGDQEALQRALDTYISGQSEKGEVSDYSLKYPTEGQYLSAFILLDQILQPAYLTVDPAAAYKAVDDSLSDYCIAFYRMDAENAITHINLLKKENDRWSSVADAEGYGEEIAQVAFADLDGNGFPELLLGWNMYNTKDKRLTIHSLETDLSVLFDNLTYTTLVTGDLNADSAEDLLLLSVTTGSRVSARLYSLQEQRLTMMGQADMDSDIQWFGHTLLTIFSDTVRGVFIDAHKDPGTTITELILWQDGELKTPFCNKTNFITTATARAVELSCRDIDEDGNVEWPLVTQLPGMDALSAETTVMKTSWYSYDPLTDEIEHELDSITNTGDGYSMELSDKWPENFLTSYDTETRILTLSDTSIGEVIPFLKIQATVSGDKQDLAENMVYFDESDSLYYAAWQNESLNMSMEEVRYLFSIL